MLTLIQKDLRQTAWPMALAWLALITPTALWLGARLFDERGPLHWSEARGNLGVAVVLGMVATLIAASSIAAVAFARERRERTAEFTATLPIRRSKLVASKLAAALLAAAAPVAVGLIALLLLEPDSRVPGEWTGITDYLVIAGAAWLFLFGLAWGLSSLLRSEVLAAAAPLVAGVIITAAILSKYGAIPSLDEDTMIRARLLWTYLTAGSVGLIAGTVVAVRRKSP